MVISKRRTSEFTGTAIVLCLLGAVDIDKRLDRADNLRAAVRRA